VVKGCYRQLLPPGQRNQFSDAPTSTPIPRAVESLVLCPRCSMDGWERHYNRSDISAGDGMVLGIERPPNGLCPCAVLDGSSTAVVPSTSLRRDSNWQLP
jgi:hypothetical protein